MINLSDLALDKRVLQVLNAEGIVDMQDILTTLEVYKFLSRQKILEILNKCIPDQEFANVCVRDVKRDSLFAETEEAYSVIIHAINHKDLIVYSSIYTEVDTHSIEIMHPRHTFVFKKVTDVNFAELCNTADKQEFRANLLWKRYLLEALEQQATDLHFTVAHEGNTIIYPVQYRRNGQLLDSSLFELTQELNKEIVHSLIESNTGANTMDISTSFGVTTVIDDVFQDGSLELRVSAMQVKGGYRCVLRIQPTTSTSRSISELGFPEDAQEALHALTKRLSGLTLITGAICTGKNTTACAMAKEMVKEPISLIGFDSPIEIHMPFAQVDYKEDVNDLLNCVRLVKKQDIDVAFLNELPTKEVALAVRDLVNSSVGVITTIHLDRIWHLPYRLKEYYGEDYADILTRMNGVVNQKMYPILCPYCQEEALVSALEDTKKVEFLHNHGVHKYRYAKGCSRCTDRKLGRKGFILGKNQPYVEYLLFTPEIYAQLVECSDIYAVEGFLRQIMLERRQSLEFRLLEGIQTSQLDLSALDSIL